MERVNDTHTVSFTLHFNSFNVLGPLPLILPLAMQDLAQVLLFLLSHGSFTHLTPKSQRFYWPGDIKLLTGSMALTSVGPGLSAAHPPGPLLLCGLLAFKRG